MYLSILVQQKNWQLWLTCLRWVDDGRTLRSPHRQSAAASSSQQKQQQQLGACGPEAVVQCSKPRDTKGQPDFGKTPCNTSRQPCRWGLQASGLSHLRRGSHLFRVVENRTLAFALKLKYASTVQSPILSKLTFDPCCDKRSTCFL